MKAKPLNGGAGPGAPVIVRSRMFGEVSIPTERVITFPKGLLGFARRTRWTLMQPQESGVFFWLQSLDDHELAFVVTIPKLWNDEYVPEIRGEDLAVVGFRRDDFEDAEVLSVCNLVREPYSPGKQLVTNLQAPLVINTTARRGVQAIADGWALRFPIDLQKQAEIEFVCKAIGGGG